MGTCPIKVWSNMPTLKNPTEPAMSDDNRPMVVSLYDIPSQGPLESSIHIGERLTVLLDDGDFWVVRSTTTGNESYIPRNYTAKVINRWQYNGISRLNAEELLLLPDNHTGAFLIRESQTNTETYSLSVLVKMDSYLATVKHYRICRLQNGWFYISPSLTFYSLGQLVEHYSESADGLCCLLREPCIIQGSNKSTLTTRPYPKAIRRPTLNWNDVDSSMIFNKARVDSEDSLVSEGLREAVSSYLYMTEASCQNCGKHWDT
ncbi:src-like-adapter 2 [Oncorhynchus nerka]|uniref:src-like-adapter 2 n=1 Tax=Oncorhynchus nerka TaxID=8023 RepID=UPI0031B80C20